jgi:hypothetical protein
MPATARKPATRTAPRGPKTAGTRAARNARALDRARSTHRSPARVAPTAPRRKSGPAKPRPARGRTVAAPRKQAPRVTASPLARAAQGGASVVLDSLLRGRGWVVLVGALLAGIVFLNVSVLELNRGIARTDARATALERKNSVMRERVASLDSAERIQRLAETQGFILPQPGDVTYLSPDRERDARLAVTRMQSPQEIPATEAAPVEPAPVEPTPVEPAPAEQVSAPVEPAPQPVAPPAAVTTAP